MPFHLCVTEIGLYRLKSQTDIYFLLLHSLYILYFKNPKKKTTLTVRDKVTACSLISARTLKYGCTVFALHKAAQSRGHKRTKCQPPSVTLCVLCSKAILPKEHLFQCVQRWDWFYLLIRTWAICSSSSSIKGTLISLWACDWKDSYGGAIKKKIMLLLTSFYLNYR